MWELRGAHLHFVLIDYDMATVVSCKSDPPYARRSKHRTGTVAFMAYELVEDAALAGEPDYAPIPHRLCHDLESIYWLCYWCMLILLAVEESTRIKLLNIVRAWETQDLRSVARTKSLLRVSTPKKSGITLPPAAVEAKLHEWPVGWLLIWTEVDITMRPHMAERYLAQMRGEKPPTLDYETAGGIVTRDNLLAKLTAIIPDTSDQPLPEDFIKELTDHVSLENSHDESHHSTDYAATAPPARPRRSRKPASSRRPLKAKATKRKSVPSKKTATAAGKKGTTRKTSASTKKASARVTNTVPLTQPDELAENDIRRRLRPRK